MNFKYKISSLLLVMMLALFQLEGNAQIRKVITTCVGGQVYADIDATLLPVGYAVQYLQINGAGVIISSNATGVFTASANGSIVEIVYQLASGVPTFMAGTTTLAALTTADATNNRFNICWTEPYTVVVCPASQTLVCADPTTHTGNIIWGTSGYNVQNQHWYVLVNDVSGNISAVIDASVDPTGSFINVTPGTYDVFALNVSWGDVAGILPTLTVGNPWSNAATFVSTACNAKSISQAVNVVVNDIVAEVIGGGSTLCYGEDPPTFTQTTPALAPNATVASPAAILSLQWEQSTDGGLSWTPIAGATSSTFNPGPLTQTTDYHVTALSTLAGIVCKTVSNVRTVVVLPDVTTPNAGANQTVCRDALTANVIGNVPSIDETGTWAVSSQPLGAVASVTNAGSVNGLTLAGDYIFTYSITNNTLPTTGASPCRKSATTLITVLPSAPAANAGINQVFCPGTTTFNLVGNNPGAGMVGLWTVSPTGPNIQFPDQNITTVNAGLADNATYTFTWTISTAIPIGLSLVCPSTSDETIYQILPSLSSTTAGTPQILCQNANTVALSAAAAPSGTLGTWSESNATTVSSINNPNSIATGLAAGGSYNYTWTISHLTSPSIGSCINPSATVTINVLNNVPAASAGFNQIVCAGTTSANLNSNAATLLGQVGTWSETGTSTVSNVNSNNTSVTGLTDGAFYSYTWTIANTTTPTSGGVCPTGVPSTVNVSVLPTLPASFIGFTPSPICSSTATTLSATAVSAPFVGTWSEVSSNIGDNITLPNNATTSVTGLGNNSYTYQWVVSNPTPTTAGFACPTSSSAVSFTIAACPPLNLGSIGNFVYLDSDESGTPSLAEGMPGVTVLLFEQYLDLDGNNNWDIGEPYDDNNGDGIWNLYTTTTFTGPTEAFIDGGGFNGVYDSNDGPWFDDGDGIPEIGEYTDLNGDFTYNAPEVFIDDNGNNLWDGPGSYYFNNLYQGNYTVQVLPPTNLTVIGGLDSYDVVLGSGQQFALQFDFALPISMTAFNAVGNCKTATLIWKVATESDIISYDVQRSADGVNYTTIETVASQGATTSGHTYTFTDSYALQNQSYYRLLIHTTDGKATATEVLSVMNKCDIISSFNVYPSPFTNQLTYEIETAEAGEYTISIIDVVGRVEVAKKLTLTQGINTINVNLDNLANAVYFTGIEGMSMSSFIKINKVAN